MLQPCQNTPSTNKDELTGVAQDASINSNITSTLANSRTFTLAHAPIMDSAPAFTNELFPQIIKVYLKALAQTIAPSQADSRKQTIEA